MRRLIVLGSFLLVGLGALALPVPAAAAIRYVATTGADGPSCGTLTAPCRSINRAITNASPGDRSVVGPGRYGDIDRDGQFVTPGDEVALCFFCGVILVDKPLTIESSAGAGATIIEPSGEYEFIIAVRLTAPGIVFGGRNKGFTVRGVFGVLVEGADATVQDNHFIGSESAISVEQSAANTRILGNVIKAGGWPGALYFKAEGALVSGNVIDGCRGGREAAVLANGPNAVITDNHIANNRAGIVVGNRNVTVRRNVLVSHQEAAVQVGASHQEAGPTGTVITSNNFGDNGVIADPVLGANCAVLNVSTHAVNAERNYWGGPQGPGNNPADRACTQGGAIDTAPYLTGAVTIVNRAGQ